MKAATPKRVSAEKPTRAQFAALGARVMSVSKEELEKREKAWRLERRRK
jgi:hypothetical protein